MLGRNPIHDLFNQKCRIDVQQQPPEQAPEQQPNNKKSKKKNKKKNASPNPISPPPQVPPPIPMPTSETRTRPTPVSVHPSARMNATTPAPGSRAAGKQPMSYAANPPSQNPPLAPSSKGARTKAMSANNYNVSSGRQSSAMTNSLGRGKRSQANSSKQNPNIWSTNSVEERERIKEFWLKLGERERRDLVKVEKEAVLKKMKEQQRHGCSCAVCGRKR